MTAGSETGKERTLQFVRNNTFLGALPEPVLLALAQRGHLKSYAQGQTIYQRGDPGDSLMLIVAGRVKITNVTTNAREVVLNFLGPGDVVGEIAALDGRERSAGAVALETTEGFVIYRRDLLGVLASSPEAMLEVIEVLCQKLRAASAIVEGNALEMTGRAAAGLLRLAGQHGRVTKRGVMIDMKLSQRDLGNYLGLSRENVSRQLSKLKDAGLIHCDEAHIYILDDKALAEFT